MRQEASQQHRSEWSQSILQMDMHDFVQTAGWMLDDDLLQTVLSGARELEVLKHKLQRN